jgi:hypothetical protein
MCEKHAAFAGIARERFVHRFRCRIPWAGPMVSNAMRNVAERLGYQAIAPVLVADALKWFL